ncbi:MAG: MBL fold metallo-hydrolase [Candidatus Micrarchaeota archaeon]
MRGSRPVDGRLLFLAAGVLLVGIGAFLYGASPSPEGVSLEISFIDVGQGDATLVVARNSTHTVSLLVDAGNAYHGAAVASFVLQHDPLLDYALATHPDADHIGGMVEVLRALRPAVVVDNGDAKGTKTFASFEQAAALAGERRVARRGDELTLVEGVTVLVLSPTSEFFNSSTSANDKSIVLKVSLGAFCAILTGDAEEPAEEAIASAWGAQLDCPVLKAGHHGSKTASTSGFLSTVSPYVVAISVGAGNRYGHPAPEALQRIAASGAAVLRTDERGSITITTTGRSYTVN